MRRHSGGVTSQMKSFYASPPEWQALSEAALRPSVCLSVCLSVSCRQLDECQSNLVKGRIATAHPNVPLLTPLVFLAVLKHFTSQSTDVYSALEALAGMRCINWRFTLHYIIHLCIAYTLHIRVKSVLSYRGSSPHLIPLHWAHGSLPPRGISISSAVCAQLARVHYTTLRATCASSEIQTRFQRMNHTLSFVKGQLVKSSVAAVLTRSSATALLPACILAVFFFLLLFMLFVHLCICIISFSCNRQPAMTGIRASLAACLYYFWMLVLYCVCFHANKYSNVM